MKKYKLKQWYPSLPAELKVGNIVEFNGVNSIRLVIREKYEFAEYNWEFNGLELKCTQYWKLIEEKYCDCNIPIFTLNSTFCMKCLKDIEEKKPLFVTEDGIEMFDENAIIIAVGKDMDKLKVKAKVHDVMNCVFFKHEANADEYILRNKKVFSYEDFMRWGNVPYERVIMQLAKERIEQ